MKNRYLIPALALLVAVAACTPDEAEVSATAEEATETSDSAKPDVTLENTYWKLVELNGAAVGPGEGRELHMILKGEGQVGGYAGCNQFTGSATVSGDGLSFGPIASTRRMCADVMQQEDAFLQALENAARFGISGEDLTVEDANGAVTMRFVAVYMQ